MTVYEIIATVISVIALIVAISSWLKSNKLAKLQIQEIEEKNRLKDKPKLNVAIHGSGSSGAFAISNAGEGSAYQLNLALIDCKEAPIFDTSERLPHPELKPNSALKIPAAFHLKSDLKYQIQLAWKEKGSDKEHKEIFWVDR